jgi:hypothetical protein
MQTQPLVATLHRRGGDRKWLWLVLALLLMAPAGAWGDLPTECSCVDGSGTSQSPCTASTVAVRCMFDTTTGSQAGNTPFSLTTLRIDANYTLARADVNKKIDFFSSPVVLEAGGARGGKGANLYFGIDPARVQICTGGRGGGGGYARTTQRYEHMTPDLYVYIGNQGPDSDKKGGKGGASSLVIGQLLTEVSDPLDPENEGVFVIAGGAGGGGACDCADGDIGADGGCAIATLSTSGSNCTFATNGASASATGQNARQANDSQGKGGNQDGKGTGAPGRGPGESGVGGLGGRNGPNNNWIGWAGSDLDHNAWPYGAGGEGQQIDVNSGGGAGGGFGGGAGGGQSKCNGGATGGNGTGGGGGGSWARYATADESTLPVVGQGNVADKVVLTLGLEPTLAEKQGLPLVLQTYTGKVTQLGTNAAQGTMQLRATYALDGLDLDLRTATVRLGSVLENREGELVGGVTPGLLPRLRGASARSASFASGGGSQPTVQVKLTKKDEGQTLALLLNIAQAQITPPQQCVAQPGARPVTGLRSWLMVEDRGQRFVLEVADRWDCRVQQDGRIRELRLSN